jgi:hypothetical protein
LPLDELAKLASTFLDAVGAADELLGHQFGPVPAGLQVMFGLNELAIHHDDVAHAASGTYRPPGEVVTALADMYDAVFGLPPGTDAWSRLLQATGRPGTA